MDDKTTLFIALMIAVFLNMLMTHFRKAKWFHYNIRWIISACLSLVAGIGLLVSKNLSKDDAWALTVLFTPLIQTAIDSVIKRISIKNQGRDFRFNTSFEWAFPQNDELYSNLDTGYTFIAIISMVLLIFISNPVSKLFY